MLGLFVTILRELLPFLKEALLEGQTFKGWMKNNWLTFAWLINTLALTMMIAHLADSVALARFHEQQAQQQLQQIQEPLGRLVNQYKALLAENTQLKSHVEELTSTKDKYEQWMGTCGVQYEDQGQCKVVQAQPLSPRRPRLPVAPHPSPAIHEKHGFIDKLRSLLHRDKDER